MSISRGDILRGDSDRDTDGEGLGYEIWLCLYQYATELSSEVG